MRTLSRPMFNMGGPIKEGVMHGIREPYRSGTRVGYADGMTTADWWKRLSNQMPKGTGTGGTTGTISQTGSKAANLLSKAKAWKIPTDVQLGRGIFGGLKKAYSMAPKQGFLFRNPLSILAASAYFGGAPTPVDKKYGITSRWENIAPMFGDTTGIMEKKFKRNLAEEANPNNPYRYNKYKHGPRKEHPDYDPEKSSYWPWAKGAAETAPLKTLDENLEMPPRDTGSDYGQFDRAQKRIAEGKATELAKQRKDDRVNKLLEIMGHKQSKKDAVYNALLDASQIVGAAPGGESLDISKDIIQPIIGATSQRFDKPKEIEEAVRLMQTKAEIEKDIAKDKGSQYDIKEKYLTGKLGKVAGQRSTLGKPTSVSEALLLTKATDSKKDRASQALRNYFDGYLVPKFVGALSEENIKKLGGKEKLVEGSETVLDDGVYQVSKSYIIVKGNQITKQEDLFTAKE